MKVVIIEDERPAYRKLARLLREADPAIEIIALLPSVEQSIRWFSGNPPPELIFMDIQLEDGICFEIFAACEIHAPVIFTTAYDQYALKAFKVNSVDYLLKPIDPEELRNALGKFRNMHTPSINRATLETLLRQVRSRSKERFLITIGEHIRSVPIADVECFYILERATFMLTNQGKNYPVDYSLEQIEQQVNPELFFRVSRNFIIHFHSIRDVIRYSSSRLKIILPHPTEEEIIVSRERVPGFKKWMDR